MTSKPEAVECGNCDWQGDTSTMDGIDPGSFYERLHPEGGGITVVPVGECPQEECGAFVYLSDNMREWETMLTVSNA